MQSFCSSQRTLTLRQFVLKVSVIMGICLLVLPAGANPPSDVSIKYDKTTNQVSVTITHPVDNPTTHYLKNVKVNINGRVVSDTDYTSQPTKDVFTYTYPVPVNAGDTIRATATCNLAGLKEGVLTLPTPSSTAPSGSPMTTIVSAPVPTKSPLGLIPILGLGFCAFLALAFRRK